MLRSYFISYFMRSSGRFFHGIPERKDGFSEIVPPALWQICGAAVSAARRQAGRLHHKYGHHQQGLAVDVTNRQTLK
jgi:hypothetical protein